MTHNSYSSRPNYSNPRGGGGGGGGGYGTRGNYKNNDNAKAAPLTIHDVSEYIHTNSQFINQTHVHAFDDSDLEEVHRVTHLEPLRQDRESDLAGLPKNLSQIFSTYDFSRKGVISEVRTPNNTDVSFVSALLCGAIADYDKCSEKIKIDLTEKLIRKCLKEYQVAFKNLEYASLGWKATELRKIASTLKINRDLLRYYADTLYVNLFILDIDNDRLAYVGSDPCIKYKKNVFLLKFEGDRFEIVFDKKAEHTEIRKGKTKKTGKSGNAGNTGNSEVSQKAVHKYHFDNDSGIIKKLINSSFCVEKLDCNYMHAEDDVEFVVGDEMDVSSFDKLLLPKNEDGNTDEDAHTDAHTDSHIDSHNSDSSDDGNNFEEGDHIEDNVIMGITEVAEFSDTDSESCDSADDAGDAGDADATNESDESDESDESEETKLSMTMLRSELVDLATKHGISERYNKNGKQINKTKKMLFDELSELI